MEVEAAIVVHSNNNGDKSSEPDYIPTEAEKISGDVAIDALPYVDTEVCFLEYSCQCNLSIVRAYVHKAKNDIGICVIPPVQ